MKTVSGIPLSKDARRLKARSIPPLAECVSQGLQRLASGMPTPSFAFIFSLLLYIGNLNTAAAEPVSFELHPASSTVLIGSPTLIEGAVRYPKDDQLSLNTEGQKLDPFTLVNVRLDPPTTEGEMKVQQVHLQVVPFDIGNQTFPELQWTLTDISGVTATHPSPPVKFQVTGPDTRSSDIHDIIGPLRPPLWMIIALVLLVVGTLSLAGYEIWGFLKPKRTSTATGPTVRKPPYEEALEALEALRESNFAPRQIYDQLAEVLRVYLERRFEIPALVLTTSDLMKMMRQAEIDRPVIGVARDLFARCDLVKFAKLIPEGPELRQDIEAGIQIVKATAPKPPPTQEPSLSQQSHFS